MKLEKIDAEFENIGFHRSFTGADLLRYDRIGGKFIKVLLITSDELEVRMYKKINTRFGESIVPEFSGKVTGEWIEPITHAMEYLKECNK